MTNRTQKLFRFGLYAKGVIYFLLGALFLFASRASGKSGVLEFVSKQSFGRILIVVLGLGLLAYSILRWYLALADPEDEGKDLKGAAKRVGYASSGVLYGTLAVSALFGISRSGGSGGESKIPNELMSNTSGLWLIGSLGIILIGVACFHFYRVITEKYKEKIAVSKLSSDERKLYDYSAKAGLTARSIVFVILGYLLTKSAVSNDSTQVSGVGAAFEFLQASNFPWLATLIAIGLAAYGTYLFIVAKYRSF